EAAARPAAGESDQQGSHGQPGLPGLVCAFRHRSIGGLSGEMRGGQGAAAVARVTEKAPTSGCPPSARAGEGLTCGVRAARPAQPEPISPTGDTMNHLKPSLNRRQVLAAAAGGAAVVGAPALFSGSAFAQDKFPSRAITLIAPWPAGGSSDGVMRAIAESGSRALGVPVVVENKPGVGGTLGASAMVNAKPDGYTLTQLPLGIYRLPHMQTMPFNPVKDITHVVCLVGYTFAIACTPDAPFQTIQEMVAYAKANPGKLEYGHTG